MSTVAGAPEPSKFRDELEFCELRVISTFRPVEVYKHNTIVRKDQDVPPSSDIAMQHTRSVYCTISTYPAGQQSALPPPPDLGRTVSSQTDAGRQIRPMVGTGVVKFSRLRRTVGLPLA